MEMNLKEIVANLAAKASNDINNGTGDFDQNIKLLKESVKLYADLDQLELNQDPEDIELKRLKIAAETDKINSEIEKINVETNKAEAEAEKLAAEATKLLGDTAHQKSDKYWDRGLKIAGIVVPAVGTVVTGAVGLIMFKQKCNFTTNTLKLNTLLEEKGLISGLNNSKIVSNLFNEVVKR